MEAGASSGMGAREETSKVREKSLLLVKAFEGALASSLSSELTGGRLTNGEF